MAAADVLRRSSDALNRAVVAFCVGCVIAMLAISFVGFFYMIVTGEALSWTYSLARLFIPWIGMLSISTLSAREKNSKYIFKLLEACEPFFNETLHQTEVSPFIHKCISTVVA